MKKLKVVFMVLFTSVMGFSQNRNYEPKFWNLMNVNGEIELYGQYKDLYSSSSLGDNKETNFLFSGKIQLNTQSYFWHPNFLVLDVDLTYNPGAGDNTSILMPDYAVENSAKRLNMRASFFRNKKVKFSSFLNYNDSYSNLENLSKFYSHYFNWGGNFRYSNKWLPITINYRNSKDENKDKYTDRHYKNMDSELIGRTETSIGTRDRHEFNFSQRNYNNQLVNVYENENNTTNLNLRNSVFFDENRDYRFSSYIYKIYQTGTYLYNRLSISENLHFNLPWNLRFNGQYLYNDGTQNLLYSKSQNINVQLQHQWYESLSTAVFYEQSKNSRSAVNESFSMPGFNIAYTKKLPLKGRLSLSYNYYLQDLQGDSGSADIFVFKEPYLLADGKITFLRHANVYSETVEVTDKTGGLIYQENIDYILIEQGAFIEIQRIPGGLIPNNTTVYIDYTAMNLGNYTYKLASNQLMTRLSLFNNLFEVYYKYLNHDYSDIEVENDLVLQYINQQLYGAKLHYKFVKIGFEKDDYESNVVPYRLNRFYANFQGDFKNKVTYSLNGNYTNYDMIMEEGRKQKFIDVAANITYNFNYRTRLDLRAGYRKQEGEGIDLDLFIGGLELSTIYRQITAKLSVDLYRKKHLITNSYDFNAVNLRIIRNF